MTDSLFLGIFQEMRRGYNPDRKRRRDAPPNEISDEQEQNLSVLDKIKKRKSNIKHRD